MAEGLKRGAPNSTEGDSEGESGDEEQNISQPFKLDDYNIDGYDTSGNVGDNHKAPPPPQPVQPSGAPPDLTFTAISHLDEAECRDSVLNFVAEHCCFGSRPAKTMVFTKITPITALHYTLESYGESRSSSNQFTAYKGGPVDGPSNGLPPAPWAIACEPDSLFKDQVKTLEVPHTSVIRGCHCCQARGWVRCSRCHGRGRVKCWFCGGRGYRMRASKHGSRRVDCSLCVGGKRRCHCCGGDGRVTCNLCRGYCKLRHYIELKITFTNHKDDYILEKTDMPDELIRDVGGKPVFEQVLPMIWPISSYPVNEVNENSNRLLTLHRDTYKNERFFMQRQILRAVPVTEVEWDWEERKNMKLWVYGNEKRVYCPDYPHQCCWGCVIL